MDVLLLTNNLMGSSRVSGVVRGHGLSIQVARQAAAAGGQAARAVVVDLELPIDLSAVDEALAGSEAERIAFGPHVDEARLEAARQAGWLVLTRGQFDAQLPELAARWAAAPA